MKTKPKKAVPFTKIEKEHVEICLSAVALVSDFCEIGAPRRGFIVEMTEQEKYNVRTVKEYMEISHDPKRAKAQNVIHLLASRNKFIAPTTYPGIDDCETYAEENGKLMRSISNLRIIDFDYIVAKDDRVFLRYSADGSHDGEPYKGIKATGRKAQWTAAALFQLENGKITLFIKEWNKLAMCKQFGFPFDGAINLKTDVAISIPNAFPSLMNSSLVTIRHYLHTHPELSGAEKHTAAFIARWLEEVGAHRIVSELGGHGVAGVFSGDKRGPRVMLRAELDALPISERGVEREWCSRNEHVAHSCGHDGHMTVLLGIAKRLACKPLTRGEVVLLFQPAEETGAGARAVIESEKFNASLRPDVAYALHNQPGRPLGEISIREGAFACASRGMIVRLQGRCSHAAHPEQGVSPMDVMCHLLEELVKLPRRLPTSEHLGMVTVVHAQLGEVAFGTTPGTAVIMVTLRTASDALMQSLVEAALELIEKETEKTGLTYNIEFRDIFAAVCNDVTATADVIHCAQKCEKTLTFLTAPNRWSEDFGVYSVVCRCAMFLLGAGETMNALHDSDYDFPDALIEHGVEMFWALLNEQRLFEDSEGTIMAV